MKLKILTSLALVPVIYLLIAFVLTCLPFKKSLPEESIDFGVLNPVRVSQDLYVEKNYVARDGEKLFYRYFQGNAKKVLILLHGSGSEGRYLLPLAERLSTSMGIKVVVPDLRGHGRSALSNLGDIEYLGQFEHDVEDLNKHLRGQFPNSTIVLGGHSSGAGLAVKYGGGEHLPFDGYLLLAPYLGYDAPTARPNSGGWVQVATRRYIGLTMFNRIGITLFNHLPVLYFNRPEKWNDSLQADSYSYRLNVSFSPQSYDQELQSNDKPILVLVGSDDESFYAEKFEPIFAEHAANATVRLVKNAKHLDLPDNEKAYKIMSEWLN